MGRRRRQQQRAAAPATAPAADHRDHPARVRCSDEIWAAFRLACGSTSMARRLGAIVEDEVARWRLEHSSGGASDAELLDALARAERLQTSIRELVERLERRVR
jgi:hypothetical protein